jgi:hypothetical protein
VDVHYPEIVQDEVTYYLPAGYSVESTPQTPNTVWQSSAMFRITPVVSEGAVTVDRVLAWNYTLLSSKDYEGLHEFFQKVAAADQQQLVLTKVAAAKGN